MVKKKHQAKPDAAFLKGVDISNRRLRRRNG
jgi:hypothetical protein